MAESYRSIDHTGDLGVEVEAEDFPALARRASWALSDTLVEAGRVRSFVTVEWEVGAASEEGLLVAQLQEILFQMDAAGRVFGEFQVERVSAQVLRCLAKGEALDRVRHGFKTEIKAVTYHGLKIENANGKKTARIIFDV